MELKQMNEYVWELPKTGDMRVPGIIYGHKSMIGSPMQKEALKQVANVASLPGILKASYAMPDMHPGYGFPIGGVAAFDWETGIICPGGVGYDINCGVSLASTCLTEDDVKKKIEQIVDSFYSHIPCGIGSGGCVKISVKEEKDILKKGVMWAVEHGFGEDNDIECTEENGRMQNADPKLLSEKALKRGGKQLGSLGGGNHFLELDVVEDIYDYKIAETFGLYEGQVAVMLHSGSRGFGYQVCDDFLRSMIKDADKARLPDRQLVYARIKSEQGIKYYNAMACAANYAWVNRRILMHRAGEVLQKVLGIGQRTLDMKLVYDVCHNIAKKETHVSEGKKVELCVHRKGATRSGATRSFPPGHKAVCSKYQSTGQPVIIPGDMGRGSYVLAGTQKAMEQTFGSTCHGAGRVLSRNAAKKKSKGKAIYQELEQKGISVRWRGRATLAEEMPEAYKDISQIVAAVHGAGISKKVAKLRPIAVVKG